MIAPTPIQVDTEELRRLCDEATDGPWVHEDRWGDHHVSDASGEAIASWTYAYSEGPISLEERNAAYIAAVNPKVFRALLDDLAAKTEALGKETEYAALMANTVGELEIGRKQDAAEIERLQHREADLLEANNRYLERARQAEYQLAADRETAIGFIAIQGSAWARSGGLPDGHLHPNHYDLLERFGAPMTHFTRAVLTHTGEQ